MNCMYLTRRSKKYSPYWFCRLNRQVITLDKCKSCSDLKYKEIKAIKNKSKKLKKLEDNRFSILQEDTTKCFLCHRQLKLDKHEAFGGSNRQKSMQWGLVYYLCRKCHSKADLEKTTRQFLHYYARKVFSEKYSEEKFLKEFGKNYL